MINVHIPGFGDLELTHLVLDYNGTIAVVRRRYIQDVGAFSNLLEIPQRWNEAVIWKLASRLVDEINEEMSGSADAGMSANIRAQQRQLTQQRLPQGHLCGE